MFYLIIELLDSVLRLLGEIAILALTLATVMALFAEKYELCMVYALMVIAIQLGKIADNTRKDDEV